MSFLIYDNKQCDDIVGTPLMVASNNADSRSESFLSKDVIKGQVTSSRFIANHITALPSSVAEFPICIFKKSEKEFTEDEEVALVSWLTSYKTPRELKINDCDGNTILTYRGLFTDVSYIMGENQVYAIELTFTADSPYGWKETTSLDVTVIDEDVTKTITLPPFMDYNIKPKVTFSEGALLENMSIVRQSTDKYSEKQMKIKVGSIRPISFDCERYIILDSDNTPVIYEDIGWDNISDISWMELTPGTNTLTFSGKGKYHIEYRIPVKKARVGF